MLKCKVCGNRLSIWQWGIGIKKLCHECQLVQAFSDILQTEDGKAFLCFISDPGPLDVVERLKNVGGMKVTSKLRAAVVVLVDGQLILKIATSNGYKNLIEIPYGKIRDFSIGIKPERTGWYTALMRAAACGAGFIGCAFFFMGFHFSEESPSNNASFFRIIMMGLFGAAIGALGGAIYQINLMGGLPTLFDLTLFLDDNQLLLFVPPSQSNKAIAAFEWANIEKIENA